MCCVYAERKLVMKRRVQENRTVKRYCTGVGNAMFKDVRLAMGGSRGDVSMMCEMKGLRYFDFRVFLGVLLIFQVFCCF